MAAVTIWSDFGAQENKVSVLYGLRCDPYSVLFSLSSKITADGDCSHEIKRCLLLGRKAMTNLDSILKSKDIIFPAKVHLAKAMLFSLIMYQM